MRSTDVARGPTELNSAILSLQEIANQSVKIAVSPCLFLSLALEVTRLPLQSQLRIAQAEVLALRQQQQHSTEGAPSGGAHHKELKGLHLQVANLSATNDLLTREKAALSEQIAKLDDTVSLCA